MKPLHMLKEWDGGFPKSECGKILDEKDTTLIAEKVTCGACRRSSGYKKLMQSRPAKLFKEFRCKTNE